MKVLIVCSDPDRSRILAQPVNGGHMHVMYAGRMDHAREAMEQNAKDIAGVICEWTVGQPGDGEKFALELAGAGVNVLLVMPPGRTRPLGIHAVTSAGDYQAIAEIMMVFWRNPPDGLHAT